MINLETLRKQLHAKINKALDTKNKSASCATCEHSFKKYKQNLMIDNDKFDKATAQFILLGCDKCHDKRIIDYIVE